LPPAHFIARQRPDILLTNSVKAHIYGSVVALLVRRPVVWYVHEVVSDAYYSRPLRWLMLSLAHLVPPLIICNSMTSMNALLEQGVTQAKLVYQYPPIHAVRSGTTNIRAELGFDDDALLVAIAGRIAPPKGQWLFLQAAERLAVRHPTAQFLIVGEAMFGSYDLDYKRALIEWTARSPSRRQIHWLGHRSDLRSLYSHLDVVVSASLLPEGLGLTVAEAMLAGCAVVASDLGASRELIEHGVSGLLFEPGNAVALERSIHRLLSDRRLRARLGTAARERVAELTRDHTPERLGALLKQRIRQAAMSDVVRNAST
jgi:glycosyltransferase involved in cell wall biosynthesis